MFLLSEYSDWVGTDQFEHHIMLGVLNAEELNELWASVQPFMKGIKSIKVDSGNSWVDGHIDYRVDLCLTRPEDILLFKMRWFLE